MTETSKFVFDDITLKEVLGNVLIKWRRILCVSLIVALVVLLGKGVLDFRTYKSKAANIDNINAEIKSLESAIEKDKKNLEDYRDYMRNSIYLNVNASMVDKGTITFSIVSPLMNSDNDYGPNVAVAYRAATRTGELSSYLAEKLGTKSDYYDQAISSDYDAELNPCLVAITCIGLTDNDILEMQGYIKEYLLEKDKDLKSQFGEYDAIIVSEDTSIVSMSEINTAKANAETSLTKFKDTLADRTAELNDLKDMTSISCVVKDALKYCIASFVVMVVICCAYYFVTVLASNKVKSENQLKYNYGFNVLGSIGLPTYKTKLDKIAYKWAGINVGDYEDYFKVIDKKIEMIAESADALIVPINDFDYSEAKNFDTKVLEDSFETSSGLDGINKVENVAIIVKRFSTSIEKVEDAVYVLESYGKNFVGIILI